MKFTPQKPVAWFSPSVLADAALKVVLSSVFGTYTDKRESFRTENAVFFDYSEGNNLLKISPLTKTVLTPQESMEFMRNVVDNSIDATRGDLPTVKSLGGEEMWIDFVSDLGDGFNATYTMAHLLAQPELEVNGQKLQRGKVLIMGGDEVYPTPSMEEYNNRMVGPYNAALPYQEGDDNRPQMYAIPGNHDWYDGLTNFVKIFCKKRLIGNWETFQQYSYFAIKLPHNVWIWAVDVQLASEMDLTQMEYFRRVIKNQGGDFANAKIVLCTAEPAWVRRATQEYDFAYEKLKTFEEKVIRAYGGQLLAVLTGDLHHYSRYECKDEGVQPAVFQRITAGGGGAFLHPTHDLPENYEINYTDKKDSKDAEGNTKREAIKRKEKAELKATFPSKPDSKKLILKNLFFPFINKAFSGILAIVSFVMGGLMATAGIATISDMFGNAEAKIAFPFAAWVIGGFLVFGMAQFTDILKSKYYKVAGFVHGIGHLVLFALSYQFLHPYFEGMCCSTFFFLAALSAVMFVVSGMWFGIYLIITNLVFGLHENEGFSSFMHEGYKNFLRLHLTEDTLTIYPIGVKEEVRDWQVNYNAETDTTKVSGSAPKIEMIENEPIVIKLK
jgi:hypothetical protein